MLPVEVGMARVDAGVEDGDDRRAAGSTDAVGLVPADLRQRPLVARSSRRRGRLGRALAVELDAR